MGLITQSLIFAAGAFVGWKAKQIYDEKKQALLGEEPIFAGYITDQGEIIDTIAQEEVVEEVYPKDASAWYWDRPRPRLDSRIRPMTGDNGETVKHLMQTRPGKMGRRPLYPDPRRKYRAGPITIDQQRRLPTRRTK